MLQSHATLQKFGYPQTCLAEWNHWAVLLRPQQATFCALVLASRLDVKSIASLPAGAYAELQPVTTAIEAALASIRPFDKINYLCLMMVDPQVHFHVLPRYATAQEYGGTVFLDPGWPGPPDLKFANSVSDGARAALQKALVDALAANR
jgi:diadenosine tetraphosphate (Ap4A) HIT family hydrolase